MVELLNFDQFVSVDGYEGVCKRKGGIPSPNSQMPLGDLSDL